MNTKNQEEITEILSKIENLRAAQVIYQNYSETYNYLIEKHFNPKMEEFAKQKGLEYQYERSDELSVSFNLKNPNWKGKCCIGFTFGENRCYYGLKYNSTSDRISDENKTIIHNHMNESGIVSRKETNWWPFYVHFTNLSLDAWENDIIKSDNFLNDCKEKIEKLLNAMNGIDL